MKATVRARDVVITEEEKLVAGSVNEYQIIFEFPEEWDGYSKEAVFKDQAGTIKAVVLSYSGSDLAAVIPHEVLANTGYIQVGVYGTKTDYLRPTVWSKMMQVFEGTEDADPSTPEEQTPWQAALTQMGEDVEDSHDNAETSEAYAIGKRGGVDVESTDPAYHNNAKYYAEAAASEASDASGSAADAATAKTAAETAQGKAEDAQDGAEDAQAAAETAQGKAEDAQEAAETAQGKAEDAQEAAETAQGKAEDAQEAAEAAQAAAEEAAGHYPKIENGYWYVWDAENEQYVSTGIHAQGDTGAQGPQGEQGVQGETGATPDFTIGTVTTGAAGSDASATITGTAAAPVLNLTIPRGDKGDPGEVTEAELKAVADSKADVIISTASGSIASFDDGAEDMPLKSCVVQINPVQASGTPSPSNPLPISGWTGCNVYKAPTNDPADPDKVTYAITWQDVAGTVYGGNLDVSTGVLTVTHHYYQLTGEESWTAHDTQGIYYYAPSNPIMKGGRHRYDPSALCNAFEKSVQQTTVTLKNNCVMFGAGNARIYFRHDDSEDVDAWKTFVRNNTITITYPRLSAITYQLTPVEIRTLLSNPNNLWADTGDIAVSYPTDTKLYVDQKISASQRLMELVVTANRENSMTATKPYDPGDLLIVNGTLYKATVSIANGAELTVGTNVTATTVAAEIAALA